MISEGCSACACGIESACNTMYFPAFALPGLLLLIALLITSSVLLKKRVIKVKIKAFIAIWVSIVLIFVAAIWTQTESGLDLTIRAAQECTKTERANTGIACEY